ncbi:hypothetical protein [Sediminibacterium sp.]|uniref:hypothetical protein n=1 Tax=Sediminibacterium sp. TaxID=1917865 RepID=UPI003F70E650
MKNIFFSLILLCSFSLGAFSQTTVKIDFKTKTIEYPTKVQLQEAKDVQIKVINIPTNLYKVNINKTDSFVNIGTPPALFNVFNFGDGFNSLLGNLTGYSVRNLNEFVSSSTQTEGLSTNLKKMMLEYKVEEGKAKKITDLISQNDCDKSVPLIMPFMTEMRIKLFDFHFKFRDQVIKNADKLVYENNLNPLTAIKFREGAEAIIQRRLEFEKEIESYFLNYYDSILPKYDIVNKCIPLATSDSMLSAYKVGFAHFLNKFDTTFNEVFIAREYKKLNATPPATEFISLPFEVKSDITKFAIDITGIDANKTPQSYNTTFELKKHPNRIWAFTTGVFVSGLKNDEFSILTRVQPNGINPIKLDTLNYSILQENNSGVSAGINALMHFGGYFSNTSDFGGFISFGPGLTLEKNPQVRVMIGAGLLFGRTNKLALTFGRIGGPVKRLSSNYNTTDKYNPAPTDITRDRFRGSWFLSLGYGLFGK